MEDFSSIVGIVVLAASIAISYIGNRQKQAKRPEHHQEAWPAETQMQPQHTPDRLPSADAHSARAAGGSAPKQQSARQQRRSEAGGRKPHAGTRTAETQRPQGRGADSPAATEGLLAGEIGREETPEPRQAFDLRQAVIYAEILKPKFEEEE